MRNKYSQEITQKPYKAAAKSFLYGIGFTDEDMQRSQVGLASMWYEGNPCNMHLRDLADETSIHVKAHDMVPLQFNTIGVSDGLTMGSEGMNFSLPSREIIADSIETISQAHYYDALIAFPGCDKNMPGSIMALCRLNRPSLIVYGGSIGRGELDGEPLDSISTVEAYGGFNEAGD